MMAALVVLALPAPATAATAADRAEERMLAAIDAERSRHGLPALRRSPSLMASAARFGRRLMATDTFAHDTRIHASDRFVALGEALAMHRGRRFHAGATLSRWLASPSHRAIVLAGAMGWQGVGVVRGRFGGQPATIWVLHVGATAGPVAGLPVPR